MTRFLFAAGSLLLVACGQQQPPAATAPPAVAPMPPPTAPAAAPQAGPDARTALLLLAPYAAQLAKAPALQADAQVQQLSQQLITQGTTLEQGPPTASLKPAMATLTRLLQAAQQKAYPTLAGPTQALAAEAGPLSGQPTTAAEKTVHYQFAQHAADLLKQLITQTPGAHR